MNVHEAIVDHLDSIDGDFVSAVEADKFVTWMEEVAPGELLDWLSENARRFVTRDMQQTMMRRRTSAINRAKSRAFGQAVEDGDVEYLGHFAAVYTVDPDSTRRRVADMTGDDHRYVAGEYEGSAKHDLMMAAFHRAVAKKVGKRRTADVLDEDKYDALLQSLMGKAA